MLYRTQAPPFFEVYTSTLTSSSDASNDVLATGSTFQPEPNSTYYVEVVGRTYSGVTTTGLYWRLGDGTADNTSTFSFRGHARASATGVSDAVFNGTEAPGSVYRVLGTANPTSVGSMFYGDGFVDTGASPTPVGVYFRPEVAASVSVAAVLLRYKKVA